MTTLLHDIEVFPAGWTAAECQELVSALTRRRLITGTAAAGLLALRPDGSDASSQPVASPVAGYPRTIEHVLGETVIPSRPARVVAVSDFMDLDYLLTLGVEPVLYGFTNAWDSGAMPWQSAAAAFPSFDATGDPDLEAIAGANPDLILGMQSIEAVYPQMSEIAPIIAFGWDTAWREGIRLAATALGLESLAEERIAEADLIIEAAKTELAPIAGKRLRVGFEYGDIFYVWGEETAASKLFKELGLNFIGGPEPSLTALSLEQVNTLDDAEILLSVGSDPAGIEMQEASPLFRSLPAVQNGGYEVLTVIQSRALGDGLSPISLPWVMPQFVELMLKLANGGGKQLG
ncbi:iron-siderophore ABC transporter substrate-binding protein [soil metagenome]